jgi:hypothetical protein
MGDVEHAFGFDTLLTDISLYWFSDDINGSLRLFKRRTDLQRSPSTQASLCSSPKRQDITERWPLAHLSR